MAGVMFISVGCWIGTMDVGMKPCCAVLRIYIAIVIYSYFGVRCHVGKCSCWATSSFGEYCIVEFISISCRILAFKWENSVQKAQLVSSCCCVVNVSATQILVLLCGTIWPVVERAWSFSHNSHWKYLYFTWWCSDFPM